MTANELIEIANTFSLVQIPNTNSYHYNHEEYGYFFTKDQKVIFQYSFVNHRVNLIPFGEGNFNEIYEFTHDVYLLKNLKSQILKDHISNFLKNLKTHQTKQKIKELEEDFQ